MLYNGFEASWTSLLQLCSLIPEAMLLIAVLCHLSEKWQLMRLNWKTEPVTFGFNTLFLLKRNYRYPGSVWAENSVIISLWVLVDF